VKSYVLYLVTPKSPTTARSISVSSGPSTFATFSKPPTTPVTEDLDDLFDDDLDVDMDLEEAENAAERLFGPQVLPLDSPYLSEFSSEVHRGNDESRDPPLQTQEFGPVRSTS
jgi:hypothetical protein